MQEWEGEGEGREGETKVVEHESGLGDEEKMHYLMPDMLVAGGFASAAGTSCLSPYPDPTSTTQATIAGGVIPTPTQAAAQDPDQNRAHSAKPRFQISTLRIARPNPKPATHTPCLTATALTICTLRSLAHPRLLILLSFTSTTRSP
jgi:hypothetical protein